MGPEAVRTPGLEGQMRFILIANIFDMVRARTAT